MQLYYLIIANTLIFAFNNKLILLLLSILYSITFFLKLISSTIDYNTNFIITILKKNQNYNLYISTITSLIVSISYLTLLIILLSCQFKLITLST
jgi:hypothetical protein